MIYLTHNDLLKSPGATELAQVATADDAPVVPAGLMAATLAGTERSAWTAGQIATADEALARIDQLIADTGELIDGYIGTRYTLPMVTVPGIVRAWAIDVLRYRLHDDLADDSHIASRYRDALKGLGLVRDGKLSLGVTPPAAVLSVGPVTSVPARAMPPELLGQY